MDEQKKEEIIIKQLGKIGETSGMVGAVIGSILKVTLTGRRSYGAAIFAAYGGRSGAEWAANRLPTVEYATMFELRCGIAEAVRNVLDTITKLPEFKQMLEIDEEPDVPILSALVGSGKANMNPTVVCMAFVATDSITTKVEIAGYAKEGLIKQKSSEKAVNRIIEVLGCQK